jgi:RNA polymerase sigma-70 factor, ECF subfamily
MRIAGQAADAQEVVQETFLSVVEHLREFRQESSFKTWLVRILVRQAARSYRRREPRVRSMEPGMPEMENAEPVPGVKMDVLAALEALPAEQREVMVLRELQGMKYEEMAQILDVPQGTVESRLSRARAAMRGLLKDYGV